MGTVEKRDKHKKRRFVSPEEKLERELKDCMHCRFFWGHNNRCANGTLMLSRLVDTFFSRTSWTMLLYAENHSISVA